MEAGSVFLVDDDCDSLLAMAQLLESEGLVPTTFRRGEDALAALAVIDAMPSLLVLDLQMPGMHGAELLEVVRREPRWCHIPIVVFTAWNEFSAASRLGIPVVRKPDVDDLLATVAATRPAPSKEAPYRIVGYASRSSRLSSLCATSTTDRR